MNKNFEKYDLAVSPRYAMSKLNEPIVLYQGPIHIAFGDGIRIRACSVTWEWRREPVILASYYPSQDELMRGDATDAFDKAHKISLQEIAIETWARCYESESCGSFHHEHLQLLGQTTIGSLQPVSSLIFHLVNCRDIGDSPVRTKGGGFNPNGRLPLRSDEWLVDIDCAPNCSELIRELNKFGGQAITHVMRIQRTDGQPLSVDEVNIVSHRVQTFLAFTTGSRTKACLPSGYDSEGKMLWEAWLNCGAASWSPLSNWVCDYASRGVSTLFPGFVEVLKNDEWQEPIETAVNWYIHAKHRGLETALTLGQAALELLANTLNDYSGTIESERFDKKKAPQRIRWLLNALSIDVKIPPRLLKLREFQLPDGSRFCDGPDAIRHLRDAIAHPKKFNRQKFGENVETLRNEATLLILFYLEHAILRICGFRGIASAKATHDHLVDYRQKSRAK